MIVQTLSLLFSFFVSSASLELGVFGRLILGRVVPELLSGKRKAFISRGKLLKFLGYLSSMKYGKLKIFHGEHFFSCFETFVTYTYMAIFSPRSNLAK